jgi:hypothetical protein
MKLGQEGVDENLLYHFGECGPGPSEQKDRWCARKRQTYEDYYYK